MSCASPLQLTFGVEMECVIGVTREQFRSYRIGWESQATTHPDRTDYLRFESKDKKGDNARERVHHAVSQILMKAEIPTNDPTDPNNNEAFIQFCGKKDYSKWTVENDRSVKPLTLEGFEKAQENERRMREKAIKIQSNKIGARKNFWTGKATDERSDCKGDGQDKFKKWKDGEEEDWEWMRNSPDKERKSEKDQGSSSIAGSEGSVDTEGNDHEVMLFAAEIITRVLSYTPQGLAELNHGIKTIVANVNLSVNPTCGLNVHVGNGADGFTFETVKKFAFLITAFEHIIESLYPDSFLLSNDCRTYAKSPSELPAMRTLHVFDRLKCVIACDDLPALVALMSPTRRYAYNFLNLLPGQGGDNTSKRTIEMRQHAGTTDMVEVTAWTDFVVGLLLYAHHASVDKLVHLCASFALDWDFTVLHLMWIIDRENVAEHYRSRLNFRQRPDMQILAGGKGLREVPRHQGEMYDRVRDWREGVEP
ncbi:hypothetical protein MMC06_000206 [Schaereria dolodes]|nr:hypothetical protein [Schaereria dolodes]